MFESCAAETASPAVPAISVASSQIMVARRSERLGRRRGPAAVMRLNDPACGSKAVARASALVGVWPALAAGWSIRWWGVDRYAGESGCLSVSDRDPEEYKLLLGCLVAGGVFGSEFGGDEAVKVGVFR